MSQICCQVDGRHRLLDTVLERAGVTPQIAQRIMRQGDYRFTMKHYTVLGLADSASTIERLTGVIEQPAVVTGTDGDSGVAQTSARTAPNRANRCDSLRRARSATSPTKHTQTPRVAGLGDSLHRVAKVERKGIEPSTSGLQSQQSPPEKPTLEAVNKAPAKGCSADVSAQAHEDGSTGQLEARLSRVVEAWDELPDTVRVAIMAMVEAMTPREPEQG